MNGISGHFSTMMAGSDYLKLSKKDKLEHDLHCARSAGYSGTSSGVEAVKMIMKRSKIIDDIKRQIIVEDRKEKLQKLQNYEM